MIRKDSLNNEEWFDIVSDFGKTLNKFASAEKTRCLINSLNTFLSSSEHPSDLLDILSYSLKDPSFKAILIESNIKLIKKLNTKSNNPGLLKIKDILVSEKLMIQKSINENEALFFLFPEILSDAKNGNENNEYSENTDWHDEYNEYLDMMKKTSPEYEESNNDSQDAYSELEDLDGGYDEYSDYEPESDRMIDEYGEDGFEAGDNFFPDSWSPD